MRQSSLGTRDGNWISYSTPKQYHERDMYRENNGETARKKKTCYLHALEETGAIGT